MGVFWPPKDNLAPRATSHFRRTSVATPSAAFRGRRRVVRQCHYRNISCGDNLNFRDAVLKKFYQPFTLVLFPIHMPLLFSVPGHISSPDNPFWRWRGSTDESSMSTQLLILTITKRGTKYEYQRMGEV
jgi:hypothetical protein